MNRLFALFFFCGIGFSILIAPPSLDGQGAGQNGRYQGLTQPHYRARFEALTKGGFKYWDKGYLITYGFDENGVTATPGQPAVRLYDQAGRPRDVMIAIPGAESVSVADAAVNHSGGLFVAGGATSTEGAIGNFIASIDNNGHIQKIIRTTPFMPVYICSADSDKEGTVWSYGFERDENGRRIENSLMLRQFNLDTGQLRAVLDPKVLASGWNLSRGRFPGDIRLRCSSKNVGLYNGSSSEWIVYNLETNTLKISRVTSLPPTAQVRMTGFAMSESGEAFASLHDRSKKVPESGLFHLQRGVTNTATWAPVPGTIGPYLNGGPIERLLGMDGDDLIYTQSFFDDLCWAKLK
ncbi:MAG TPA: hypothetical protein VGK24_20695 [Candidatus Angelobacter sp.]|jgi:hypothetical protein